MVVGLLMVTGTLGHSAVLCVVAGRKSEIDQEVVLNLHQHTEGDHALEMGLIVLLLTVTHHPVQVRTELCLFKYILKSLGVRTHQTRKSN